MKHSSFIQTHFMLSFLVVLFGRFSWKSFPSILLISCIVLEFTVAEEIIEKPKVLNTSGVKIVSRSAAVSNDSLENKFHINQNTIIRTQESRSSGAKYLNDSSVTTNHECLMWCWETHGCNAVVFQQKAKGSCYLFDCGSPNDFHCKFTRHNLYISSILKVTQHSYDLNQWGKEVKHENELAKLRNNGTEVNSLSVVSPSSMTTVETKSTTLNSPFLKETENSRKTENKCHHYQFQCINNSECIAIYNVCDGIPQCSDASDESELHCPTQNGVKTVHGPATTAPPIGTQPSLTMYGQASAASTAVRPIYPTSNTRVKVPVTVPERNEKQNWKAVPKQEANVKNDVVDIPWIDRYIDKEESDKDYKHHTGGSEPLGTPFIHKHSQFVAANDPHVQSLNRWSSDYDEYPQHSGPLDQQYNAYENNFARPEDQYSQNQFVPDFESSKQYNSYRPEDVPYWPSQGSLQDTSYPSDELMQPSLRILKPANYPDDSYVSEQLTRTGDQYPVPNHHGLHKYMGNMPGIQQSRISNSQKQQLKQKLQPYLPYEENHQQSYPNYPEVRPRHYETPQHGESNMYSKDDMLRTNIVNKIPLERNSISHLNHLAENRAKAALAKDAEKNKLEAMKKKTPISETKSITKVPSPETKPQTVLDFKMSVTELFQSSRTHIHETNSAVLALVLGLIITALLVVLSICRIRTIRRKLSRKGRTLAHDADYLVNGMYL